MLLAQHVLAGACDVPVVTGRAARAAPAQAKEFTT